MRPLLLLAWRALATVEVEDLSMGSGGFLSAFSDGRWGYGVPWGVSAPSGTVSRFEMADWSDVYSLNLANTDANNTGFLGGFASGGYGFVLQHGQPTSRVVRFDTRNFIPSTIEVLDLAAKDASYIGFHGTFVAGAYGYCVPLDHGKLVRFDWQFFQTQGVQVLDLEAHDGQLTGFTDGFGVGGHGYLLQHVPISGKVVRFSLGSFSADSIEVLDFTWLNANLQGYKSMFTDGTHGYALPWEDNSGAHGRAVRFLLETFDIDDVLSLDLTQTDSDLTKFRAGCATQRHGFMFSQSHGKVAVFELAGFNNVQSVDLVAAKGQALQKFGGAFSDGLHAYGMPFENADVARVHIPTTTTTSATETRSSTSSSLTSTTITTPTTISSTSSATLSSTTSGTSTTTFTTSSSSSSTSSSSSSSTSSRSTSSSSTTSSTSSSTLTSTTLTSTTSTSTTSLTSSSTSSSSSSMTTSFSSSSSSTTQSVSTTTFTATQTSLTSSLTATTTLQNYSTTRTLTAEQTPLSLLEDAVAAAVDSGVASLVRSRARRIEVDTPQGVATVVDLSSARAARKGLGVATEAGSVVALPAAVVAALPSGSVLALLDMTSNISFEGLGQQLAARPLEISLRGENGALISATLPEPLLLRLPGSQGAPASAECVFLETGLSAGERWSRRGVRRASDEEVLARGQRPGGVWCLTEHLSIFSAVLRPLLGCTNLELLTMEGTRALSENEGWYRAESAVIVFVVWALMALVVLAGNARELFALRLGRTEATGKHILLCRRFMTLGPQVLKHKYTVFVVYARDVLGCLVTKRTKLKRASLTATVQRFLALRSGVAVPAVTQHCWDGGRWTESKASLPLTVLCCKLEFHAEAAERIIQEDLGAPGVLGVLRRFVMTALAIHPLLDAMRVGGGSMTAAKRTSLQVAGLCGVIATNALIFNFSGGLRSWEAEAECPIEPTSQLFVVVATIISLLVNALPNAFLTDVAKQVHGRPLWNLVFWLWTLAYLLLAALLILLALANLNARDAGKWYAALEWGITFKLLGMPLAQALRHSLVLEHFLREDRACAPTQRFRVGLGLSHPSEAELTKEALSRAESMARKAISAQELLQFLQLLGRNVMPHFDAATSTSDDVMKHAVEPFCLSNEDYTLRVEVSEALGLDGDGQATCALRHLDMKGKALWERHSDSAALVGGRCSWRFEATVTALLEGHALEFAVAGLSARLTVRELLQRGGWSGELRLQAPRRASEAAVVPEMTLAGSRGSGPGVTRLLVTVTLPEGAQSRLPEEMAPQEMAGATKSVKTFCEAKSCKEESLPPSKMVVHSRLGSFAHLVSAVLADASGSDYSVVAAMISKGEFDGLQQLLKTSKSEGRRYWLDMFAVNPTEQGQSGWHESFLASWPAVLRTMRRASCRKLAGDIEAGRLQSAPNPFQQLLVLDEDCHFLHEMGCLAELMLARAMQLQQRFVLAPSHLQGAALGQQLKRLASELNGAYKEYEGHYTAPYVEDKEAVFEAVRELVVASVKEQEGEEALEELNMADLVATVAAVRAQKSEPHDVDGAQLDGNVDVDVDG